MLTGAGAGLEGGENEVNRTIVWPFESLLVSQWEFSQFTRPNDWWKSFKRREMFLHNWLGCVHTSAGQLYSRRSWETFCLVNVLSRIFFLSYKFHGLLKIRTASNLNHLINWAQHDSPHSFNLWYFVWRKAGFNWTETCIFFMSSVFWKGLKVTIVALKLKLSSCTTSLCYEAKESH